MEKTSKLVEEIVKDFENRKDQRRNIERNWLLNINFLVGNQHSYVLPSGELSTQTKDYYWQEREVYNHIAPIIETRLSKFGSLKGGFFIGGNMTTLEIILITLLGIYIVWSAVSIMIILTEDKVCTVTDFIAGIILAIILPVFFPLNIAKGITKEVKAKSKTRKKDATNDNN